MKHFLQKLMNKNTPSESTGGKTELFSKQWMERWKQNLNESDNYAYHGKSWNAPIILKVSNPLSDHFKESDRTGIFIDLQNGQCHELRYAQETDESISDVILKADEKTWVQLLTSQEDPAKLIMLGKISIEKGSLVLLSTQRKAAAELIKSAPVGSVQNENKYVQPEELKQDKKRKSFKTTGAGLNHSSYPMQLFQKSKKYGVWNPYDIALDNDIEQWKTLTKDEREIILHLLSLFMAGEEAVTSDLLPLIKSISDEGRIEEEIYLTSFLWEEAKHVEFFSLYKQTVIGNQNNLERFHGSFYKKLFYEILPSALSQLNVDSSPAAQLKASITYNMIVEGTLAETGYEAFYNMLNDRDLLKGLRKGITKLKQDESRHIAYGLYLINRLLEENPDLRNDAEELLTDLLDDATNIIHEIFEPYDTVPFNLEKEWFLNYAIKQFQLRIDKLGLIA